MSEMRVLKTLIAVLVMIGASASSAGAAEQPNIVFNAGTIWYAQGLSTPPAHVLPKHNHAKPLGPDPRAQRMTKNVFDRFIGKAPQ
jgi:hypothetical protein